MRHSLITDIDGTLLKKTEVPPLSVLQALQAFVDQGNILSLCTGRPLKACKTLLSSLPEQIAPSIFFGGALIWDIQNDKELYSVYCDNSIFDLVKEIYAAFPSVSITMNTSEDAWTIRTNETLQSRGIQYDKEAEFIEDISSLDTSFLKVLLTCDNPKELEQIEASLIDSTLFHGTFASTHFYEITDKSVNKGTAIQTLKEIYPPLHEYRICAAGDALSDYYMKDYVDLFAAPTDAHKNVVSVANFVFPPAKEGGIIHLIDHLSQ